MRHVPRAGLAILGALAVAGQAVLVSTPVASAAGWDQGPVQFSAYGDDQCQLHFTIVNRTNSFYVVDFAVDGEDPTALQGKPGIWSQTGQTVRSRFSLNGVAYDISRVVGRPGVQNSAPLSPTFPGATYENNREPITTTRTVNLLEQALLPNRASDTHTVTYQVTLGPQSADKGFDSATGTFALLGTSVSGCQAETTSTLTAPSTAEPGSAVTLEVRVDPPEATGAVQFFANGEPIGSPVRVVVVDGHGVAVLPFSFPDVGERVITAVFTPDPVSDESSDTPYGPSEAGPVVVDVREEPETGSLGSGSLGILCGDGGSGSAGSDGSAGSVSGSLGSLCGPSGSSGSAGGVGSEAGSSGSLLELAGGSGVGSGVAE
ncbi:Ig-like domain-containing protein [Dietzia sp. UBA5065]|uniref:Ig-like domain-containing protein n=1 Tax=Dietzia sp. UBA5065 TaxID=1946422 RepID=UPI0025BA3B25|nr:Ig-like domain-containing protein [Dietzia sp. UBA5065]